MVRDPTSPRLVRKAHLFASAQEALEKACKASSTRPHQRDRGREGNNDSEADVPSTKAFGAICVQNFNDSRGSAIHTTYRISLRPSSLRLPRHPWFAIVKVVFLAPNQKRIKSFLRLAWFHNEWLFYLVKKNNLHHSAVEGRCNTVKPQGVARQDLTIHLCL